MSRKISEKLTMVISCHRVSLLSMSCFLLLSYFTDFLALQLFAGAKESRDGAYNLSMLSTVVTR